MFQISIAIKSIFLDHYSDELENHRTNQEEGNTEQKKISCFWSIRGSKLNSLKPEDKEYRKSCFIKQTNFL